MSKTYAWVKDGTHRQQVREGPPPPIDAKEWICFDSENHTYTDERGMHYLSGTAFIKRLDDSQFCPERVAIECASQLEGKYANMQPHEIMQEWLSTADVGTEAHEAVELSVLEKWRNDDSDPLQPIVDQFNFWRWNNRSQIENGKEQIITRPERIIWNRELRIAGMADLVSYNRKTREMIIDDIKTWSKLTSDRQRHAEEQITLYAFMLQKLLNIPCRVGGVVLLENYFDKRGSTVLTFVQLKERTHQIMPAIWARNYECRRKEDAMALSISGGVKTTPKRVVVYGTEGVGKSTFASRFPQPVFIDTEGSTDEMDVQRLPTPKNWNGMKQLLADIRDEKTVGFKTLVIDTLDWAENKAADDVAKSKNKKRLADIGFGRGELALAEDMKAMLETLDEIQAKHNVHIVLTSHAAVKRFDPPDMVEGFDRYELKLRKHTSPLIREWCNLLLFANFASKVEETESDKKKGTGDGTERLMYTTRTDAYDAKNRHGLDNPLPFAYKYIKHLIEGGETTKKEAK